MNKWNMIGRCVWSIIVTFSIFNLYATNKELHQRNHQNLLAINLLKNKCEMLESELRLTQLEFETFVDLTSQEFENTWISFGRVRDNFLSIGYVLKFGEQLEEKDITPAEILAPKALDK